MNKIQIFSNEEFGRIRTIIIDGITWFCGRDACNALGYKKPLNAISQHCKGALKWGTPTKGGFQMMTYVNEPDLYRLIVHSKLESAQRFESWVFEEVLPTIRRTGSYGQQKCIDCRIFEKIEEVNANVNSLRTEIKERLETEPNCKISVTINEKPLNKGSFQPMPTT